MHPRHRTMLWMTVLWKPARCSIISNIWQDILTVGDLEERVAMVDELMKEGKIAFLGDYEATKRKEGVSRGEER